MGMLRGVITLLMLSSFLGVVVWTLQSARKSMFDAAARLPLEDAASNDDARIGTPPL